ncbi:5'-nucleotidase domain-containing protein 3 [Clonorchis sinensis]|uniref:5'-nucleotidase domain-containing protein 3 n=1 Tax=Clonorchis sinensis TaxID=79923 RepID=A0A8T1MEP4_CLOSI|nr:5'-nucleotidase domain-containing protein 3 [Clonorchis sinensis]
MVRVSTALCWNVYFFIRSRGFLSVTGASTALRHFSVYSKPTELQCMQEHYLDMCKRCEMRAVELTQVDPNAVFVNNEVKLSNLQIFGFDFDHTLATYTKALDEFIFNEARDWMVKQLKYPDDLMNFTYSPDFAIRGLHYDVKKGYLMKVDAYHHIQLDTVYRGFTPVSYEETLEVYNGSHLPSDILKQNTLTSSALAMRSSSKHPLMFQLMDFFTIPEFYLLSSIIELFERQKIKYQPINVYQDVSSSVSRVHKSGLLGLNIMANPERHIYRDPHLPAFLNKLVTDGRKLFLISNSSAAFIDRGMRFLIGEDWRELFDVIISRANKPLFFQQSANQFRHMDDRGHFKDWEGVRSLSRGHIYDGGCLEQLISLTHWNAQHILYFGDHVYSDLADVSNLQGWTTAAVIPELEHEIMVNNTLEFRRCSTKLRHLEELINSYQHAISPEARTLLRSWQVERNELRISSKISFNKYFGSIFRSFHNPSYFSRRLAQYAVLYTSKVSNIYRYPLDHIFYPKRTGLPHEPAWWQ